MNAIFRLLLVLVIVVIIYTGYLFVADSVEQVEEEVFITEKPEWALDPKYDNCEWVPGTHPMYVC